MSAICLLSFALALGQNFDRGEWSLVPQYEVGLELVYRGTCTEESLIPGVRHQRLRHFSGNDFLRSRSQ